MNEASDKPSQRLSGKAAQFAGFLGCSSWSASLTHTQATAAAVAAAGE